MPELPEVETIRRGLEKYLVGHKILNMEVRAAKIFQGQEKNVIGAKVKVVKRIGKGLIIELDNNYALAIHLKLTGQVIYKGSEESKNIEVSKRAGGELPGKFTHVIFKLSKGAFLYYNDLRKFGWIKVIQKEEIVDLPFFKEMGPEPPITEISKRVLTLDLFKQIVSFSKMPIKLVLMDQKKIGGIGNIYANEALFVAGIDPRRKAKQLKTEEIKKLYNSILEVLKKGIKYGGSSDVNYVNALGKDGSYQEHFLVYGRKGGVCKKCGGVIEKIFLGGRGTYFCPKCQE